MPDVTGFRAKFAAIVPSTNTVVEHDFNMLAPPGVTIHSGRFQIERPQLSTDAEFEDLLRQIDTNLPLAVSSVATCKPDYYVMGMSAGTFWDGLEGNQRFEARLAELTGNMGVSTGATSCKAALNLYGAERISVLTPYQPIADYNVARYFKEVGFDVVNGRGLKCPSATAIAEVTEADLIPVLKELDGPNVDAIVQCGTNLSMVRLAAAAEQWLGKPVIAINTATLWHALRAYGINDKVYGFGSLMENF